MLQHALDKLASATHPMRREELFHGSQNDLVVAGTQGNAKWQRDALQFLEQVGLVERTTVLDELLYGSNLGGPIDAVSVLKKMVDDDDAIAKVLKFRPPSGRQADPQDRQVELPVGPESVETESERPFTIEEKIDILVEQLPLIVEALTTLNENVSALRKEWGGGT